MTPLILLAGFLGAGKTTCLQRLLPALREVGLDPHVIINDYQNARVDAQLLDGLAASILPISGSCVCCGSREELLGAMESFDHQPERILVVEANGTTDTEELIELLSLEPGLRRFTLPVQISLIDAKRWQKRFWHNALERDQVRTASYLQISRLDEVSPARREHVEKSLTDLGIHAPRPSAPELATLLAALTADTAALPDRAAFAHAHDCECGDPDHHHGHDHDHVHDHTNHDHTAHHFASLQVALPALVSRAALEAFLDALPETVIRAKGVVRLDDSPEDYHVFQKVDRFDGAQLLPIGKTSRLAEPLAVFIGPEIPEDTIRAGVAALAGERAVISS